MGNGEKIDKFVVVSELARRRGFFWQSYEIYGGVGGFVTYGPLGAKLKLNIENKLREIFVNKLGIFEIESPIIAPSKIFEASGHVEHFMEPMVQCLKCKKRFRADHLLEEFANITASEAEKMSLDEIEDINRKTEIRCPECSNAFGAPQKFSTMFKTNIGPYSDEVGYGRPEAAQSIFVEFNRLYGIAREKLPFGVIQIGHALRNEISPRQSLLRLREFTIADLEFFFDPEEPNCYLLEEVENETLRLLLAKNRLKGSEEIDELAVKEVLENKIIKTEWQTVFMAIAKKLLIELGVLGENQRFIEKLPWEKAHYSSQSFDQEVYVERWGWVEVSGHAYRTDFDLKSHMESSGVDMKVFKEYGKPIPRERVDIKPVMAKLGPTFKGESAKVIELLYEAKPEEVAACLRKDGYCIIGEYKILPEYVEIIHRKTLERGKRFIPHVVEPSFGSDRLLYVVLEHAYRVKADRVILSFPRDISPIQIGVYPLVSKDGLVEVALEVHKLLVNEGFVAEFDESGSIGRRYARADEIGIPLGVTIDYTTLRNGTVTVRDRDSWRQVRNKIKNLPDNLHKYFKKKISFKDLSKL